jgi:hypothetical protein
MSAQHERAIEIDDGAAAPAGSLVVPEQARGIVVFGHASGSGA